MPRQRLAVVGRHRGPVEHDAERVAEAASSPQKTRGTRTSISDGPAIALGAHPA